MLFQPKFPTVSPSTGGNTPLGYKPRPILGMGKPIFAPVGRPRPLRPLRPSVPYHTHSIETGGPRRVNNNYLGYPRPMPKPMPRPFLSPMPRPNLYNSSASAISPLQNYSNASGGGCSLWMCEGY